MTNRLVQTLDYYIGDMIRHDHPEIFSLSAELKDDINNINIELSDLNSDVQNISAVSGNWDSTYSTVLANSGDWGSGGGSSRTDYGALSGNPISSPNAGDIYFNTTQNMNMFYDDSRSVWLSDETTNIGFGRLGNVPGGVYFRTINGLAFSPDSGYYPPYSGMIIGLSYTRSGSGSMEFDPTSDGNSIIDSKLSSSSNRGNNVSLSGRFASDTVIGVRNSFGSNDASNVNGIMVIKWLA